MEEVLTTILVPIVLGLIASVSSIVVAVINNHRTNVKIDENTKENELNNIRQQILIMLLEDRMDISEKKIPGNYQNICYLYDKYVEQGGNSYIKNKVDKYFKVVGSLEVEEE